MQFTVTQVSTLGDLVVRSAEAQPGRYALVLPNQRVTYGQLRVEAIRSARALAALGVKKGDHVGILIPNCLEYAETLFGIALLGAVAVPLNARHKASEIGFIVNNAELSVLVTSNHEDDPIDFQSLLNEAFSLTPAPKLRHVVLARGKGKGGNLGSAEFHEFSQKTSPSEVEEMRLRVRVRDPALIIYTSGTTANPKGCVLSHEAATRGPVERSTYRLAVDGNNVAWGAGPLFHIGTLAPFIGSVGVAGTFLTDTHFDAGRALELMYRENVTLAWPWFAAIMQGLMNHPAFDPQRLQSLRHLFIIAPAPLVDAVQRALPGTEVNQGCGMTETAGIFALSNPCESFASRSNTQGKVSPGVEVKIVDPESGNDLPDGTIGEIWVRGYNVMDGYWASPEKTAETLTADGWLRTGDLYTRQPDGSLIFGGRLKDMLKVGGENVAAVEVEAFLCTHPAVKTVEVVGRPDLRLDEVPVAFVELHAGQDTNEDELIAHCRGRIANYKVPRAIHFMSANDWPMSATKIDKRGLRERLKELSR